MPAMNCRSASTEVSERCADGRCAEQADQKLSKGYRQRVGLAQAIIHNPDVLILDEPTSGLDPKQITETRTLIKSLAGDHTIILSTHILPEVEQICEQVIIISKGKVVAKDSVDNLTNRLRGSESIAVGVESRNGARSNPCRAAAAGAGSGGEPRIVPRIPRQAAALRDGESAGPIDSRRCCPRRGGLRLGSD